MSSPMYDPEAVQPMRDELTAVGFEEVTTAAAVDQVLADTHGTVLVVINSVCGCAAGSMRPGVGLSLQHKMIPDRIVTAFAGNDREAVDRIRQRTVGIPPSSPSAFLFQGGKVIFALPRHQIERRSPSEIAADLTAAFDQLCHRQGPSIPPEQFQKLPHVQMCGSSIPRVDL